MMAIIVAVVPSGSVRFKSAPTSARALAASVDPCRAACIKAVHPPFGSEVVTMPDVMNLNSGKVVRFDLSSRLAPFAASTRIDAALLCAAAHICAGFQQQLRRVHIVGANDPVQGSGSVGCRRVEGGLFLEECSNRSNIALLCRLNETAVRLRGANGRDDR